MILNSVKTLSILHNKNKALFMYLAKILKLNKDEIIDQSIKTLRCSHSKKYSSAAEEVNKERLSKLFDLSIQAIEKKDLVKLIAYVEKIALERFESGYDFREVHSAFNSLEETIWNFILTKIEKEKHGEDLGIVSTVLGAGKEALAAKYILLASKNKISTFDMSALFRRE